MENNPGYDHLVRLIELCSSVNSKDLARMRDDVYDYVDRNQEYLYKSDEEK